MKLFTCWINAFLAFLALSFTFTLQDGVFKGNRLNSKLSYTCPTITDVSSFFYCKDCARTAVTTGTVYANIPLIGTCTFANSNPGQDLICDEVQNVFCCFQEERNICLKSKCGLPKDSSGFPAGVIHYKANAL